MRQVKLFFMAAALTAGMSVYAQQGKQQVIRTTKSPARTTAQRSVSTLRPSQQQGVVYASTPEGWSSVYAQWNPSSLVPSKGDSQSFTGLTLGYSKAIGISASSPLFVEAGAALQYSFYSESYKYDGEEYDTKFNMLSVKVPVNIVYDWQFPNSNVNIRPFGGLTLRGNLSAKMTEEDEYDKDEYNLFDKDDMGGSSNTWKRLQLGWQIGANASFGGNFYLGLSYGSDFSEIAKKVKIHTTSITVGFYLN